MQIGNVEVISERFIAGLAVAGLMSCGPGADSAASRASSSYTATLEWRAGGLEESGGLVLEAPWAGALGPDGAVAVVDWRGAAAFVLDSSGRVVTTIGSRGSGPGQFLQPALIGFTRDDLIWVSDQANGRVSLFGLDGRLNGTITREAEPVPGTEWSARGAWLLAGGVVLGESTRRLGTGRGAEGSDMTPLALWGPSSDRLHVADWVPLGAPRALQIPTRRGVPIGTTQFIAGWSLVAAESGGEWFFALDRMPPEDGPGRLTITRYSASGARLGVTTIGYDPRPVDSAVHTWLRRLAGVYEDGGARFGEVRAEDVLAASWIPAYLPPVREVMADGGGYWMLREGSYPVLSAEPGRWERYDLSGRPVGQVHLPGALRGLAGSESAILGWRPDSSGVPVVELYRIRPQKGGVP